MDAKPLKAGMPEGYQWFRIPDEAVAQLAEGAIAEVTLPSRTICLARWQGKIYAFANKCPHASFNLAEGCLDGKGRMFCPLHGYRFNLKNGYDSNMEGYRLVIHPVEQRDDGLYAGLREPPAGAC